MVLNRSFVRAVSISRSGGGFGDALSQPRTPASGGAHSAGARSLSLGSRSVGGASVCGSLGNVGGAGGSASAGRTMREYDEGLRDLKKENFNLKLRIYFLEERLGKLPGDRPTAGTPTAEGQSQWDSDMDLKVKLHAEGK